MLRFHPDGTVPAQHPRVVFVFGSNLAGRHGAGAALVAKERFGAVYGNGKGFQGRSYAIPTKDRSKPRMLPLPVSTVAGSVVRFLQFAADRPDLIFFITRIGCGLAGHKDADIAPLFRHATSNCWMPEEWRQYVERTAEEIAHDRNLVVIDVTASSFLTPLSVGADTMDDGVEATLPAE